MMVIDSDFLQHSSSRRQRPDAPTPYHNNNKHLGSCDFDYAEKYIHFCFPEVEF